MNYKNYCLIAMVVFLFSCQTTRYWTDSNEDADFGMFQTYLIDDECSEYNPGINPILQQRIKNAIEIELRDLGYQRSSDPDLSIKYLIKNETNYFYENCLPEYDDIVGGSQCVERVYTYEEGTLVIDFIDVKNNLAIWHGGASGESWDRVRNTAAVVDKMVKKIIGEYAKEVVFADVAGGSL